MRYFENKWIGEFNFKQFVDENKEHFPLLYAECQKRCYFMLYSWSIMVRIYKVQGIDHPTGVVIYDERAANDFHIYVLNSYNATAPDDDGNRHLLKSFLEKANKISVSCKSNEEVAFFSKRSFKLQNECNLTWIRGKNGNSV